MDDVLMDVQGWIMDVCLDGWMFYVDGWIMDGWTWVHGCGWMWMHG